MVMGGACERCSGSDDASGGCCQALVEVPPGYLKVGHFLVYLLMRIASGGSRALRPAAWYILARYAADGEMKIEGARRSKKRRDLPEPVADELEEGGAEGGGAGDGGDPGGEDATGH